MQTIPSTEAKTNFGALLDAAQRGPVCIEKKGRPVAVMVSREDYDALEELKLKDLRREIQIGLDASRRGNVVDGEKFVAKLLKKKRRR